MEDTKVLIQTNRYQTPVTQELLDSLPSEVAEQLMDCLTNIQFIKNLISPDRPYYKDLPRDERGAATPAPMLFSCKLSFPYRGKPLQFEAMPDWM